MGLAMPLESTEHGAEPMIIARPQSRRSFLLSGAAIAALGGVARDSRGATLGVALRPGAARAALRGRLQPRSDVWAYNGTVPGPEIRARQGDRLRVLVENGLSEETTVHWHGVRLPNAMDGVPHVTQPPIGPGESFLYDFVLPDAGTYWYHPHANSAAQLGRGLYGALIVEEASPIPVDRDLTWVLSDFRLTQDGAISGDFANMMDASHAGRIGNTITINGAMPEGFAVRAGERLRLRLINAANARIFSLGFEQHRPWVVALDGQPIDPHEPENGRVELGPGMRADLILDMSGDPDQRYGVVDGANRRRRYRLVEFVYSPQTPLRRPAWDPPTRLADNPLSEPTLRGAERHLIELNGGMMNPRMMRGTQPGSGPGGGGMMGGPGMMGGGGMTGMRQGAVWTINGVAAMGHRHEPLLTLRRGRSYVFEIINDSAWHHPMHLHGLVFRVLTRNGQPVARKPWRDTVLMEPGEKAEIAFVADNPGEWMLHCHILEHQESGMMGIIRIM